MDDSCDAASRRERFEASMTDHISSSLDEVDITLPARERPATPRVSRHEDAQGPIADGADAGQPTRARQPGAARGGRPFDRPTAARAIASGLVPVTGRFGRQDRRLEVGADDQRLLSIWQRSRDSADGRPQGTALAAATASICNAAGACLQKPPFGPVPRRRLDSASTDPRPLNPKKRM